MFSLQHREELPEPVQRELDQLVAHLKGFLSQSFNEDGTLITGSQAYNVVPTGSILPYAGGTAPDGWLLCDGSQVNRVDYKALFDVIGTTYGIGDGSTTYNLPDLRGRFPLGKAAAGTGSTLGGTGGSLDHTHTVTTGIESSSQVAQSGAGAGCAANNHTHTGTTAGNNPPYQVVNHIILANRRTV